MTESCSKRSDSSSTSVRSIMSEARFANEVSSCRSALVKGRRFFLSERFKTPITLSFSLSGMQMSDLDLKRSRLAMATRLSFSTSFTRRGCPVFATMPAIPLPTLSCRQRAMLRVMPSVKTMCIPSPSLSISMMEPWLASIRSDAIFMIASYSCSLLSICSSVSVSDMRRSERAFSLERAASFTIQLILDAMAPVSMLMSRAEFCGISLSGSAKKPSRSPCDFKGKKAHMAAFSPGSAARIFASQGTALPALAGARNRCRASAGTTPISSGIPHTPVTG